MVVARSARDQYLSVLRDLMADNDPGIKTYVRHIVDEDPYEAFYALTHVADKCPHGLRMIAQVLLESPDYSDWGRAHAAGLMLKDEDIMQKLLGKQKIILEKTLF